MKKKSSMHENSTAEIDLEAMAEKAGRYARKVLDEGSLGSGGEALKTMVTEEPVKAAFVALGVGFFLGVLLRR